MSATRHPGETEQEARQRLAIERGDFRTPEEKREDERDEARNLWERTTRIIQNNSKQ